jgi:hypothetical protein
MENPTRMSPAAAPRTVRRFRPLAALLAVSVSGLISPPAAALAAPPPTITVNDVTVTEGNAGTLTMTFTVSQNRKGKSSVQYSTAPGTAMSPSDFAARTGTLRFRGNHRNQQVAITIAGDTLDEPNEQLYLRLSNAVGATIADAEGTGTITDNDAPPAVSSVATLSVPEGNNGDNTVASIDVTLSAPSAKDVSVDVTTQDGSATAGSDYSAASGTVDFAPGQTTGSFVVQVAGDNANEGDETFDVDLTNPENATLGTHPTVVTIQDNDSIPPGSAILNVTGATVREGNAGTKTLTFTVTRSDETTTAVNVDYQTGNGTAAAAADFAGVTGNLSFAANETTATVEVQVNGDRQLERRFERFFLSLVDPSAGAAVQDGQAMGRIRDDDSWTRFTPRKVSGYIRASGRVSPSHPGKLVVVTLTRKVNGDWVRLGVRRPALAGRADLDRDGISDSRFSAQFPRPRAGQCRIVVTFGGDADHGPSRATRLFAC